ncbi:MAG: hypothetical protein MRY83_18295 [Flavobacteriales bacterium]|nr:hypothetical protein [Flavobacteriales bacterium]
MRKINISNDKGRDAVINFISFVPEKKTFYVDENKQQVESRKIIKGTSENTCDALLKDHNDDLNELAHAMLEGDPEIDLELTGKFVKKMSRVYINQDSKVVYRIKKHEKVYDYKGELKEERAPRHLDANIVSEKAIKWSGKLFPKKKAFNKFVFIRKYQLSHNSGLTFDFLYDMAKELDEKDSLMLVGSGNGSGPVVFQDGGNPFRVFLEGKISGDKYMLIMHLSNMELKPLPEN